MSRSPERSEGDEAISNSLSDTPSPFIPLPSGKGEEKEKRGFAPLKLPFYLLDTRYRSGRIK